MIGPIAAFGHASDHRDEILAGDSCGCFCCCSTFRPSDIKEWTDKRKGEWRTALCPKCGTDSVLGNKSGYPITRESLARMKDYWFGGGRL